MYDVLSSEVNFETDKSKINNINRLMNVFRTEEIEQQIQTIYLYFLIGLFWIKFTTFHKTVQQALGQFLSLYHYTIDDEFNKVVDIFDMYLQLRSNNKQLFELIHPEQIDDFYDSLDDFKFLEIHEEQSMEIVTVHENILKGLNYGIEKMPNDIQNRYTQRFIKFLNNEYYIYHHTISDFDESKLEI